MLGSSIQFHFVFPFKGLTLFTLFSNKERYDNDLVVHGTLSSWSLVVWELSLGFCSLCKLCSCGKIWTALIVPSLWLHDQFYHYHLFTPCGFICISCLCMLLALFVLFVFLVWFRFIYLLSLCTVCPAFWLFGLIIIKHKLFKHYITKELYMVLHWRATGFRVISDQKTIGGLILLRKIVHLMTLTVSRSKWCTGTSPQSTHGSDYTE